VRHNAGAHPHRYNDFAAGGAVRSAYFHRDRNAPVDAICAKVTGVKEQTIELRCPMRAHIAFA
jgi:hypothetical protein